MECFGDLIIFKLLLVCWKYPESETQAPKHARSAYFVTRSLQKRGSTKILDLAPKVPLYSLAYASAPSIRTVRDVT